jgi:hypothetical protein
MFLKYLVNEYINIVQMKGKNFVGWQVVLDLRDLLG